MGLSDFLDNITDLDTLHTFYSDLKGATSEFKEEIIDACQNEGVDMVRAAPAAIKEMADIARPLVQPTPTNLMASSLALQRTIDDLSNG